MSARIGARELRQNLSAVLKRVQDGEHLIVTSHNLPVAELTPLRGARGTIQRMIDEGRATPADGPMRYEPIDPEDLGERHETLSEALDFVRGESWEEE